jgi:RHS repeat-associated protein
MQDRKAPGADAPLSAQSATDARLALSDASEVPEPDSNWLALRLAPQRKEPIVPKAYRSRRHSCRSVNLQTDLAPLSTPRPRQTTPRIRTLARIVVLFSIVTSACSSRGDHVGASASERTASESQPIGIQDWQSGTPYKVGDLVEYAGKLYQAVAASTNAPPSASPSAWQLFDAAKGAPGVSGDPSKLVPLLDCVAPVANAPGTFTAVFAYQNNANEPVLVPIGDQNKISMPHAKGTPGRGQPVSFGEGTRHGAFFLDYNVNNLPTWTLGPRSISPSSTSTTCTITQGQDGPMVNLASGSSVLLRPDPASILANAVAPYEGATVGSTPGDFAVTGDGAAAYGIPLWTPPARMGIGPALSLSYGSRGSRGLLGMGWNVAGFGISRVTRCRTTIAQDGDPVPVAFNDSDAFCLDGQRMYPTNESPMNGQYPYGLERDPFTRILFNRQASTFQVFLRDGRILSYGSTLSSRHNAEPVVWNPNPGGPPTKGRSSMVTYAWGLDSVRDLSGNQMNVTYQLFIDDREALAPSACTELLPEKISYTAGPSSSQPALRSVQFTYERPAQSEPSCRYVSGFAIGSQARIKQITMSGPGTTATPTTLRWYTMKYSQSALTGHSLLDSVKECASPGLCKPLTTFEYEQGQGQLTEVPNAFSRLHAGGKYPSHLQFADLNGDGKDDVLFKVFTAGSAPYWTRGYALSDGKAFGEPQIYSKPIGYDNTIDPGQMFGFGLSTGTNGLYQAHFLNNLGQSCKQINNVRTCGDGKLQGSDLFLNINTWTTTHSWDAWGPYFIGDFDGNGDVDLIGTEPTKNGSTWRYWLSNSAAAPFAGGATGFDLPVRTMTDPARALTTTDTDESRFEYVAPLDGTGKSAFLFRQGAIDSSGTHESPNLVAVTANAMTGDIVSKITTLPTGPKLGAGGGSNTANEFHYQFIDLNGDGNADVLRVPAERGTPQVALNTGAGIGPFVDLPGAITATNSPQTAAMYEFPGVVPTTNGAAPVPGLVKIADLNEDGLPDLLIANDMYASTTAEGGPIVAYTSMGAQGVTGGVVTNSNAQPILQGGSENNDNPNEPPSVFGVDTLDFDGDGRPDVYAAGKIYAHTGQKADQLVGVHDGLGKDIAVEYEPIGNSATYTPGEGCHYPQSCVRSGLWVVSRYSVTADWGAEGKPPGPPSSDVPPVTSFSLAYADGRSDVRGRGWLGFAKKTVTDDQTGATEVIEYNNAETDTGRGYPQAGLPMKITTTTRVSSTASSTLLRVSKTITTYETVPALGIQGAIVRPTRVDSATTENRQYLASGATPPITITAAVTTFGYDAFNNLNARSTTWGSGESRVWSAQYDQNQADGTWLLSLLRRTDETSEVPGQPSVTRSRSFDPDPATGLLHHETIEPGSGPSLAQETLYLRDAFGQVIYVGKSAIDPLTSAPITRESRIAYDAVDGIFPVSVTNALGHVTRTVFHPGLGVLAFREGPDGVASHSVYDGFGRSVLDVTAGHGATTTKYRPGQPYLEGATVPGLFTVETDQAGGGHWLVTYNALGHEVARGTRNHDGTFSYTETLYATERAGQIMATSLPHAYTTPTRYTSFGYDVMGRRTWTRLPDGSQESVTYNGVATTVTDPRGYARTSVTDDRGRPIRIDEDSQVNPTYAKADFTQPYVRPGSAISTAYVRGPFDVLKQVSVTARDENGGGTTLLAAMEYDDLGRRVSIVDADSGKTVTSYNALGEVTSEGDANGQIHVMARDNIGRIIADYSTQDGTNYFQWDTAPNGVGALASATSHDQVTTFYGYDAFGRRNESWASTPLGPTGQIERTYDAYGRVSSIGYPVVTGHNDGLIVTYGFDAVGEPSSVSSNDTSAPVAWKATDWQADGQLRHEQYGTPAVGASGDAGGTTRTYDQDRGWLKDIRTDGDTTIQKLHYEYDTAGNMHERDDAVAGTKETFHNDFLNRLDTWSYVTSAGTTTTTLGYTDLGAILSRTTSGASGSTVLSYVNGTRDASGAGGNEGVHALKSVGKDSYAYDAKGNQITGPTRGAKYTSFNLPKSITKDGATTAYLYDAGHQRVAKTGPHGSTLYLGGLYEKRIDTNGIPTHIFYVPGANRVVAQVEWTADPVHGTISARKVNYLHDDHLGSIESVTGAQTTTQHLKYDPFGRRIDAQTLFALQAPSLASLTYGFTAQEHDDDLGLINMRGRMYDPSVGRFLSPDPLVPDPKSSQGYNRYGYVYNNPLRFSDPSGFAPRKDGEGTASPPNVACGGDRGTYSPDGNCNPPGSVTIDPKTPVDPASGFPDLGVADEVVVVAKNPDGTQTCDSNGCSSVVNEGVAGGTGGSNSGWLYGTPAPTAASPPAASSKGTDLFAWGSISSETPALLGLGVRAGVEGVALGGYNTDAGFFAADIAAIGGHLGSEQDNVGMFKGTELSTGGTSEGITLVEANVGPDVGLGGFGVTVGGYKTASGDRGVFVGISGGILGQHGAVGVGFSLPDSWF